MQFSRLNSSIDTLSTPYFNYIVKNKTFLIKLFWRIIIFIWIIFFITIIDKNLRILWTPLSKLSAQIATISLTVSLIPGILKRLEAKYFLQKIQVLLMLFRRQIGISTYWFALLHFLWIKGIDVILGNVQITPRNSWELWGSIALLLLTPLFITSNNQSIKILAKHWKILHKAVYLIGWIIVIHILLAKSELEGGASALLITIILEIASFMKQWFKDKIAG